MKIMVPEMLIYKNKAGKNTVGLTLTKAGNLASRNGVKSIQLIPEKTEPLTISPYLSIERDKLLKRLNAQIAKIQARIA